MVMMFSNILVAYDDSEQSKKALKTAIKIASLDHQIEVKVLTVLDIPSSALFGKSGYYEETEQILKDLKEEYSGIPNPLEIYLLEGNPAPTIVEFAKEMKCDLIVMGNRGRNGGEFFLGSVSHNVTQLSPISVFIVK